jgi:hypothetical protein
VVCHLINALTVYVEFGRFDFSGYPTLYHLQQKGEPFLAYVTATNTMIGELTKTPAMIATFSRASFTCPVAMVKSARYAAAS